VDSQQAETYLRLLAERKLRVLSGVAGQARMDGVATVRAVAFALVSVGAVDAVTAGAVVDELAFALDSRVVQPPGAWPGGRWWPHTTQPEADRPAPVPRRVVAVGVTVPVGDGTVYILSYVRAKSGAVFAAVVLTPGQPDPRSADPTLDDPLDGLTATDEAGTGYRLSFSGGGPSAELSGWLTVEPDPPPDLRWLEITGPGTPAQRIDLVATPEPEPVAIPVPPSRGEQLLNLMAAHLLASLPDFTAEERRALAAEDGTPSAYANLGDIVAGLKAVGALAEDSPVPGQLAALCEPIGIDDHGLTPVPDAELPEHWAGMLASDRTAPTPPDGCAGAALTLPEMDGVALSVLGLHNAGGVSTLHVHASGVVPWFQRRGGMEPTLPLIWLRDSHGGWHVTQPQGGLETEDGEDTIQMRVIPPLARPDWIEVLAIGRSAELRATVPLRWG
jgi:hypothetical protein